MALRPIFFFGALIATQLLALAAGCGRSRLTCASTSDCLPGQLCYAGTCIKVVNNPPPTDSGTVFPPPTDAAAADQPTGPPVCQAGHACEIGQRRCSPSLWISQCVTHPQTGCRTWSPAAPCPNNQNCTQDQCPTGP